MLCDALTSTASPSEIISGSAQINSSRVEYHFARPPSASAPLQVSFESSPAVKTSSAPARTALLPTCSCSARAFSPSSSMSPRMQTLRPGSI